MNTGIVKYGLIFSILSGFILSACSAEPNNSTVEKFVMGEPSSTAVTLNDTDTPQVEVAFTALEEMIPIQITTADGRVLNGIYYPAAIPSAPLVVLMHWAAGDQTDMAELAMWLQNRGLAGTIQREINNKPWLDPGWFPAISADKSYAVLTFTFDGCEGGCSSFIRDKWLLDAQAAAEAGYVLEGIDRNRVVFVGASIGADGAADGCLYLNGLHVNACQGAFSISPGNYLTADYAQVVAELSGMVPAVATECLYAKGDGESARICQSIDDTPAFQAVEYSGNYHGLMLVQPGLEHDALSIFLQFLGDTLGE